MESVNLSVGVYISHWSYKAHTQTRPHIKTFLQRVGSREMGRYQDLSDSDKGQIVMDRVLGQRIFRTRGLLSMQWRYEEGQPGFRAIWWYGGPTHY